MSTLECGKCRACCRNRHVVFIEPAKGDDIARYRTTIIAGRLALERRPDGDCVYLDLRRGCTIHDTAPAMCKAFDCRVAFARFVYSGQAPDVTEDVLIAGRKRASTLSLQERLNI